MSALLSSTSSTEVALRAVFVIGCAMFVLAYIARMKPATSRRPAVVRVDNKPTPLYREPLPEQRVRALAKLSGSAVLAGVVLACLIGFAVAFALSAVSGLLD